MLMSLFCLVIFIYIYIFSFFLYSLNCINNTKPLTKTLVFLKGFINKVGLTWHFVLFFFQQTSDQWWTNNPRICGGQRSQGIDFMRTASLPLTLLTLSSPLRRTSLSRGRIGMRELRRTLFTSKGPWEKNKQYRPPVVYWTNSNMSVA